MFDWKGYITNVMRNLISVSSFVGATCALLDGYMIPGALFIIIYAITATDEEWYYTQDDDDDTEKKG